MERSRFLLRPKFIVVITVSLAVILIFSAIVELSQIKKEILHIMSEEAGSLIESIVESSDNAALAYSELENQVAERLLNNARMIASLDAASRLSQQDLARIVQDNSLYRINVFDENGTKLLGSHDSVHNDIGELHDPKQFIETVLDGRREELVIGFKESRFGFGSRYAVAVGHPRGGAVVVNIDANDMLRLRREIGVGRLINDIADKEGIHYVVIQDTAGIIAASKNITSMSRITADPFLAEAQGKISPSTRLTTMNGIDVFEAVAPFYIEGASVGLVRIGLKTDHIAEANARTKRRLVVISLILLASGVLVFSFIIVDQNYSILGEAYLRTKTYTGNILTNMTDGVVAIDRDERITLFNRAAEALFQTSAEDAIGTKCSQLIHTDSVLESTLRTGQGVEDLETQYELGGRKATLSISTFCLKDKSGNIDSAVAVVKDFTERKALEENLRRKEKLTAMGELASGVAHEVRNPLNAISMIAQRLNKEFEPKEGLDEYKSLSRTVVNEVQRINAIILRFLKFARPPKLEARESDLTELLDRVIDLVHPDAERKGVELIKQYQDLPSIRIDPNQMQQVFLNLLQNSVQAISHTGKIWTTAFIGQNEVVIEIRDNGTGIPPENLSKIFDLYFTTKESGTGMGLSIANQIVTAHGGRIEVESELAKGTTFRIHLAD